MKQKNPLFRLLILVAAMMCALGTSAAEAYACYTSSTLTFYYDNQRNSRSGKTYSLNTGSDMVAWYTDGASAYVTKVVFDPSFADARPTTTLRWFYEMKKLEQIIGIEQYLNTSEVTSMGGMFFNCSKLSQLGVSHFVTSKVVNMRSMFSGCSSVTSLDLSRFNTSKVTGMYNMFTGCTNLRTIYAGSGWSMDGVVNDYEMFKGCTNLLGGRGTTYDPAHVHGDYAHIDERPSNPGYFTDKSIQAYACYTSSNSTLKFYYDNQRSSRSGKTYSLNSIPYEPGWYTDGTCANVVAVVFDSSFGDARPTSTFYWFYEMENLQGITGIQFLNTSEVTDMRCMFSGCSKLLSLDLSWMNTSKVTDMAYMFRDCSQLTSLDPGHFNTSKVTDMCSMFSGCSKLSQLDVRLFDTRNVVRMEYMFRGCSKLTVLDLSGWNTGHVEYMSYMFGYCTNLRTIYVSTGWSTFLVHCYIDYDSSLGMFSNCINLVGGKGTTYDSGYTNKTYARIDGGPSHPGYLTENGIEAYACYTSSNTTLTFYNDNQRFSRQGKTYDLNTGSDNPRWRKDLTCVDVTEVVFDPSFADARPTSTCSWFYYMPNLESITGIQYLNTSEVTDMSNMFSGCSKLSSIDLRHFSFNTSKVTKMQSMFSGCSSLTSLDLGYFNTSKVTNMYAMFSSCRNLRTIYVSDLWRTTAVTDSRWMFEDCYSLMGGKGTTYSSNHITKTYAHIDGGPENPGYFTAWGTTAYACYTPSNTTLTFYYDTERTHHAGQTYDLNTLFNFPDWVEDGTNVNVTKVVIDPSFAVARPTSTYLWFDYMHDLSSITGLEYLNTSEVTDMSYMFAGCRKLTSIDVSGFNTSKVTNMQSMFEGCRGVTRLDLSSFHTSNVTDMDYMFNNCANLQTIYAGAGWSTASATESDVMFYNCTRLVGGKGTTYNLSNPMDKTYARIDGGPSKPGYFTEKNAALRGDVNGDSEVNIADVNALINIILTGKGATTAADVNGDGEVNIADVNALIDYILSGSWN